MTEAISAPAPLVLPSQAYEFHLVEKDENDYPVPVSQTSTPRHQDGAMTGLDAPPNKKPRRRGTRAGKNRRRSKLLHAMQNGEIPADGLSQDNSEANSPTSINTLDHDDDDESDATPSQSQGNTPSHMSMANLQANNTANNTRAYQAPSTFTFNQHTPESGTRRLQPQQFSTPSGTSRSLAGRQQQAQQQQALLQTPPGVTAPVGMPPGMRADADRDWRNRNAANSTNHFSFPAAPQQQQPYMSRTVPSSPNRSFASRRTITSQQGDSLAKALRDRLHQDQSFNGNKSSGDDKSPASTSVSPTRSVNSKLNADAPEFTPKSFVRQIEGSSSSSSSMVNKPRVEATSTNVNGSKSSQASLSPSSHLLLSQSKTEVSSTSSEEPAAGFFAMCAYILMAAIAIGTGSLLSIAVLGLVGVFAYNARDSLFARPAPKSQQAQSASESPRPVIRRSSSSAASSSSNSPASKPADAGRVLNQLLGSQQNRRKSFSGIGSNNNAFGFSLPASSTPQGISRRPVYIPRPNTQQGAASPQLWKRSLQAQQQAQQQQQESAPVQQLRKSSIDEKLDSKSQEAVKTPQETQVKPVEQKAQDEQTDKIVKSDEKQKEAGESSEKAAPQAAESK